MKESKAHKCQVYQVFSVVMLVNI